MKYEGEIILSMWGIGIILTLGGVPLQNPILSIIGLILGDYTLISRY